ncbi:Cdc15p [Rhizophagus irregularis DAOM 197198w]|uniref:Cdc15p n=1 Tax=Rhizophagus irregularis (strain DAOM 197198w) TaxID=1432141 RepID=A0A015ND89_RHIIW|nr:Cdc15p [Rhizophagus irregularis DAOM 197198w]
MSLSRSARTVVSKIEIKCIKCKIRITTDENHETCQVCYGIFKTNLSGNKVIDGIIRNTQVNFVTGSKDWILEFIPYDQFKDIEFIAEGGFSKIYKAIWVDGPIDYFSFKPDTDNIVRKNNFSVVLKRLDNSKNITSEELNELKVYYQILSNDMISNGIGEYFGITQEPNTKDMMIIMPYYELGDLMRYLSNNFYNISWRIKLDRLSSIILGLVDIHRAKIIHRDLHSGNIFFDKDYAYIGDLGISRSATESNNDNERYGIIPYMAPGSFIFAGPISDDSVISV